MKTNLIVSVPQDLSKSHDWPVAQSIVRLANQVGGKLEKHLRNSLSQLGVKNKGLSATLQRYYSRLDKVDGAGYWQNLLISLCLYDKCNDSYDWNTCRHPNRNSSSIRIYHSLD